MRTMTVLLILGFTILITFVTFAQAPPPSSNPPGAPFDVVAGLLLTSGIGLGIRKLKRQ
ncbi:MAG: hypothetical protein RL266_378 [Bacteroidota bacterium]|jgi:hypothetical protein